MENILKRVLILDTPSENCINIQSGLEQSYSVKLITQVSEIPPSVGGFEPDIIICGSGFSGSDISDNINQIRQISGASIIALLSPDEAVALPIKKLFTDFVCIPVRMPELIARIELHCRNNAVRPTSVFTNGELLVDHENCKVYMGGIPVRLTMLEYKFICLLAKNCGAVVTYDNIIKELWNNCVGGEIRSLRVIVAAIRDKLSLPSAKQTVIQTHMGIGYCMPVCPEKKTAF